MKKLGKKNMLSVLEVLMNHVEESILKRDNRRQRGCRGAVLGSHGLWKRVAERI